jgi:hypothetical protein
MLNLPIKVLGDNILLCGIGGGFDIYGTLPLYHTLTRMGKKCYLHSHQIAPLLPTFVDAEGSYVGPTFLPEGPLAKYLRQPIYIDGRIGPKPLRNSYEKIIKHHNIHEVIMIDCGVDSLMKGDEEYQGTVGEEFIAFAAWKGIPVKKTIVNFGFGCEVEEKISHYRVLENIAELIRDDAFLGSCSLTKHMKSFEFYRDAYDHVSTIPNHKKSHIHPRLIPAVEGSFGLQTLEHETVMSSGVSALLSPLMGIMWFFDGDTIIENNQVVPLLENHINFAESIMTIQQTLRKTRKSQPIPY